MPVYGLGSYADGRPFYAMRFIKGDSLQGRDRAVSRQPAERRRTRRRLAGDFRELLRPVRRRLQRHRLRPQPRRAAPRPEARQHHARQVRRDAGRRLGPGQGRPAAAELGADDRSRRDADAALRRRLVGDGRRPGDGHAGVHEPGAGGRPARRARPGERRLQPRGDAVRPADRASRRSRRRPRRGDRRRPAASRRRGR